MFDEKTYWLVGASEGLGRALARHLNNAGANLVLSARNENRLDELARELGGARVVPVDLTSNVSIEASVDHVGPVDGLIYCAGAYEPMKSANWDDDAVDLMCQVNFLGAVKLLGRIVPDFVKNDFGHVVLIGSLAGHRGLPGAIGYGASKAALMHLGETIYADLHNTGVKVQVINPGFIETRLTAKNEFTMPMLMTPDQAAEKTIAAMRKARFETNFPAPFSWLFTLSHFVPRRWFLKLMKG